MRQVTINVPDNYPQDKLQEKIKGLETSLKKEADALQQVQNTTDVDPWDALDIEAIAVDTGRKDGSIQHDHYIYGTPKR